MSLHFVPIDWEMARQFTTSWHRHHPKPPPGHKFLIAVAAERTLVGIGIVGRPVARAYDDAVDWVDDPFTLEVNRTTTDGYKNANSMIYGACARVAFAFGYDRVITYTQKGESGASLKAAGWRIVAERPPRGGWDCPSRPREDQGTDNIPRTLWEQVA